MDVPTQAALLSRGMSAEMAEGAAVGGVACCLPQPSQQRPGQEGGSVFPSVLWVAVTATGVLASPSPSKQRG